MMRRRAAVLVVLAACAPAAPVAPRDWRDEVLYEIVIDRFDDADPGNDVQGAVATVPGDLARHQGGDWKGVTRHLDYLVQLGVTALWISPLVANVDRTEAEDGYHGYWAADFTRLNPRFGSESDLVELVAEAHRRGIKVIADTTPNHAGRVFFYDLDRDGVLDPGEMEPPFKDDGPYDAPLVWLLPPPKLLGVDGRPFALGDHQFHRRGASLDPVRRELADFPTGLRDLDTEDPTVVDGLIATHLDWIRRFDLDGFRLDAVPHAPLSFWRSFAEGIRAGLPEAKRGDFFLLGEVFNPDPTVLARALEEGALDSVFDFSLKWDLIDGVILEGRAPSRARAALEANRALYPAQPAPHGIPLPRWPLRVCFADNHDLPRIASEIPGDPRAAVLALVALFTVDAIPALTYGTEQGLTGGYGHASRAPLWKAGFDPTSELYQRIAYLAALRREHLALRRGPLVVRYASDFAGTSSAAGAGLIAYERSEAEDRVLVVLNAHASRIAEASIPTGFAPSLALVDLISGDTATTDSSGALEVSLGPRTAAIFAREDR